MCLCVYAKGYGDAKDTHVSCYAFLMMGQHDNLLEWPFQGTVKVELLNQLEDKDHCVKMIPFNETTKDKSKSRVIGHPYAMSGPGHTRFISHAELDLYDCQYLKDDTLFFRVSVEFEGASKTKPWLV
jgi:TNF receptor-associated factor 4